MILWFVNSQALGLPHFSTCQIRSVCGLWFFIYFFSLFSFHFCLKTCFLLRKHSNVMLVKSSFEVLLWNSVLLPIVMYVITMVIIIFFPVKYKSLSCLNIMLFEQSKLSSVAEYYMFFLQVKKKKQTKAKQKHSPRLTSLLSFLANTYGPGVVLLLHFRGQLNRFICACYMLLSPQQSHKTYRLHPEKSGVGWSEANKAFTHNLYS